jgi:two-component system, response regulator FlrC
MTDLIVADPKSRVILNLAGRVASTDATVLICGPSGVGKEVYARFIHSHSSRAAKPFVAINCAAIPEHMLEAMLFGYEKGAFTGAVNSHPGKFEQANGGTLLLDEISEMELSLQAKLLRALQEREIERLGSTKTIQLDVRVIATSNRDLKASVKAGEFREDLFYRLSVFPLFIPALRDRPHDILPLATHFLGRDVSVVNADRMLSTEAAQKLIQHTWPGNVRELDNVIQRSLILRQGDRVEADDIQFEIGMDFAPSFDMPAQSERYAQPVTPPPVQYPPIREYSVADAAPVAAQPQGDQGLDDIMREQERRLIEDALRAGKSKKAAAEILGISPRTLRYKMARLREQGCAAG